VRNEANSEWRVVAKKDGSGWTPYRQGTALGTASVQPDNRYAHRSNNLSDLASAATARANLGAAALASPTFTGVPAAPTAAAATNTTQLATTAYTRTAIPDVLNATGSAPMYACRAWVNFDGTGTVTIRASGNVSSITDNGTGDYSVNFTTDMEAGNYAATANWTNGLSRDGQEGQAIPVTYDVGWVRIRLTDGNGGARNGSIVSVAIFR